MRGLLSCVRPRRRGLCHECREGGMTAQSSDGEVHTSHGILPSTARPEGRAIKGGGNR
nr:MAG TPA: hypothetical protein [Caudoviricetes sp.]